MTSADSINFKSVFESAPGAYLLLSVDLKILATTDAYIDLTGIIKEKILEHDLFDIFYTSANNSEQDGIKKLRSSLNKVLKNKTAHFVGPEKFHVEKPDGTHEEKFWSILNKPVLNDKKEIIYLIHIVNDATAGITNIKNSKVQKNEQKEINKQKFEILEMMREIQLLNSELEQKISEKNEKLTTSTERYRHTLDNMLEGVQIIGFDWRYLYVNDSLVKHSHFTREELLGYTMMEKYPGIEMSEVFAVIKNCMEKRTAMQMENEFVYPDNSTGWFELSIQPVPEGVFILSIDITERKKAQAELQKFNEKLEKKVAERTEQLEEANKELEAFCYSVSHDLRAPLRAINGYANIIEEEYKSALNGEGNRLLGVVQYNAQKMGTLIDDLLSFSRLGRKHMDKSLINMTELTEGALYELNKTVQHKATVKINELHPALTDYGLMHQVIINLLSNAIKYSSRKEAPFVEIKSEEVNGEIIYSVSDNGAGFDMKYADKLFGVFQRLHSDEEFEGTGVGLAIVKRIINKHDGKIWVDAKSGKGASFYFIIPST